MVWLLVIALLTLAGLIGAWMMDVALRNGMPADREGGL